MDRGDIVLPSEVVADVVTYLAVRDGKGYRESLMSFMRSETGRRLMAKEIPLDTDPLDIVGMYYAEVEGMYNFRLLVNDRDFLTLLVIIMEVYSERFDVPLKEVVDLFESHGIYELVDGRREEFMSRFPGWCADYVKRYIEGSLR